LETHATKNHHIPLWGFLIAVEEKEKRKRRKRVITKKYWPPSFAS
jgi:hypothetical protein